MPAPPLANTSFLCLLAANTVLGTAMPMLIILGGLAGLALAPSPTLATLPPSVQTLAGLGAAGPMSLLMGRFGRRAGFVIGGMTAAAGGLMATFALFIASFALLCLAHVFLGAALACYLYFRFAAAEAVSADWQPVAISLMLTSGLVAAIIGPEIFVWTSGSIAHVPLSGAYLAVSAVSLFGLFPLLFVRTHKQDRTATTDRKRGTSVVATLRRRPVQTAILAGAVSQGIMVLLMAPTPLAMTHHGHSEMAASDVVRWHVVAMFAPSFFTGFLIKRFGATRIVAAGLVLLMVSAFVAASGLAMHHFYTALIVLGIGWNFGFIGATSLLATAIAPEERAAIQGANDTLIALAATVCVFLSGALVTGFGWTVLALGALPVLAIALVWVLLPERGQVKV